MNNYAVKYRRKGSSLGRTITTFIQGKDKKEVKRKIRERTPGLIKILEVIKQ